MQEKVLPKVLQKGQNIMHNSGYLTHHHRYSFGDPHYTFAYPWLWKKKKAAISIRTTLPLD